ncbi:leucine-rich repeat extensin-like protein 2 [Thunnus maccoyii]|uniref:leucine-rich repeat extensin-like protein 2 n=1 Tax=Thunnus maccoyii TaxID=8240 RepID=UPI001C4D2632|nr:leucine-rich repeat extensin-like protein 2 [Thunnus maccoyii]
MAHSDAALFQAINIFNRMFAHLRRALKEMVVPLLRNDDEDKLSNSMQTLLLSTLSPAAQILPLFRVNFPPTGRRTAHTDDVTTPPTTTEPKLLQPGLKARLNSGYKSHFTEPTTKPGSSCSSLPPPPPPLWTAAQFRVPRPAPPVRHTSMTSRRSQLLQPSRRARLHNQPLHVHPLIPASFPLPFRQLQLPQRFRLHPPPQLFSSLSSHSHHWSCCYLSHSRTEPRCSLY